MAKYKHCDYCDTATRFKTVTKVVHTKEYTVNFSTTFCICCLTQTNESADVQYKDNDGD